MLNNLFLKILTFLISIIDYSNKKKVLIFFKYKLNKEPLTIIDIGAHKGETIDFFIKNFNINKIFSFEPNTDLFFQLKNKLKNDNDKVELINL